MAIREPRCRNCKVLLTDSNWPGEPKKNGRWCNNCRQFPLVQYYINHADEIRKRAREYYASRKDELTRMSREYYKTYHTQILAQAAAFRESKGVKPRDNTPRTLYHQTPKGRYCVLKNVAKARGVSFDLPFKTYEYLLSLPCEYCRFPLDPSGGGLDQVQPGVGYITDNVVPCCKECNIAKHNWFTLDEMREIGAAIGLIKSQRLDKVEGSV